jgi:hypothetical protein
MDKFKLGLVVRFYPPNQNQAMQAMELLNTDFKTTWYQYPVSVIHSGPIYDYPAYFNG